MKAEIKGYLTVYWWALNSLMVKSYAQKRVAAVDLASIKNDQKDTQQIVVKTMRSGKSEVTRVLRRVESV